MIEFLLLDLDDTILDFHKQERVAIEKTLSAVGIAPTEENCQLYSRINKQYWKRLELGEVTREELVWGRFAALFETIGVTGDPVQTSMNYVENLSEGHYFLPGAEAALQQLHQKYPLYMVSNGNTVVQERRLKSADMEKYFKGIFISQSIGADKPSKAFFDYCFARIPGFDPAKAMIVGDSLSSDIQGGINAGITTCWINPVHKAYTPGRKPDYEIESLAQLPALLETL